MTEEQTQFAPFKSIERIIQNITITEKIHGTNAQILIADGRARAGSRTRWIYVGDDNFGFAQWVFENEAELVVKLRDGQHFGEWYGQGINAGYGLQERRFALFNTHRWTDAKTQGLLPERVDVVPVLYSGAYNGTVVDDVFAALKTGGSVLVPGYAKPEGIVVRWERSGTLMKRTFEAEDAAWTYASEKPMKVDTSAFTEMCAPYWQPMRLEKLLSRDEVFARDYPRSLPSLVKAYVEDLVKEDAVPDNLVPFVKKNAYPAIKGMMAERGYAA